MFYELKSMTIMRAFYFMDSFEETLDYISENFE